MENNPISPETRVEDKVPTPLPIKNTIPPIPKITIDSTEAPVMSVDNSTTKQNVQISVPPTANISTPKKFQKKNNLKLILNIIKNIAKALVILTILSHFWLQSDLSEVNKHLSKIGISNTGEVFAEQKREIEILENEQITLSTKISRIQEKINKEEFSTFHQEIKNIQALHINWFDKKVSGELQIGLFDAAEKVVKYFQSTSYKDSENIISKGGNSIEISSQSITRESANISITASQTFKRLFYLSNEITNQLNAYPFFKDGKLSQFSRVENETGEDSMQFSINLNRQKENESDLADLKYEPFYKWISNNSQ